MNDSVVPKRVVYLIGAGATQAEADWSGDGSVNLLMRSNDKSGEGVSAGIMRKSGESSDRFQLDDDGVDIEKLISLLSDSGTADDTKLAARMRKLYFKEIRDKLIEAGVYSTPTLAISLLQMHSLEKFASELETLTGILTTNHDGLLQVAFQIVVGGINLGFPFDSNDFQATDQYPFLLQLHGSFTWSFGVPIFVQKLADNTEYSLDTIWIPPTILKEAKAYPFNKLTGMAYALLVERCDVLRIVGSSLTQNDWNILTLIFNAQQHRKSKSQRVFDIELILPPDVCREVQRECSYLNSLTSIGSLPEGQFDSYQQDSEEWDSGMDNVFAYWLKEKITYHHRLDEFGVTALPQQMNQVAGGI